MFCFACSSIIGAAYNLKALTFDYYKNSCPNLEDNCGRSLVRKISLLDGLPVLATFLRLIFRDCQVQVCILNFNINGLVNNGKVYLTNKRLEAVSLSGGPLIKIRFGRKDSKLTFIFPPAGVSVNRLLSVFRNERRGSSRHDGCTYPRSWALPKHS
ncbi:hypothetical protein Pint_09835 [Pistacia integerrima]|uniref:Uncharacterized protein n=1 Tax=Pistacia integerrima TaxID=434235 RepID=A0ACC0XHI0_9ROSI|nr:hypothetical protein Pint_09835 [Pistacia integerrima]